MEKVSVGSSEGALEPEPVGELVLDDDDAGIVSGFWKYAAVLCAAGRRGGVMAVVAACVGDVNDVGGSKKRVASSTNKLLGTIPFLMRLHVL